MDNGYLLEVACRPCTIHSRLLYLELMCPYPLAMDAFTWASLARSTQL
jgi:hypothetical protein